MLLSLGTWLRVRGLGKTILADMDRFALFLGVLFILAALSSLMVCSSNSEFRPTYQGILAIMLVFLLVLSVMSWILFARRRTEQVRRHYQLSWVVSVEQNPLEVCKKEKILECRAFSDTSCAYETCAQCPCKLRSRQIKSACYPVIIALLGKIYLPTAIGSMVLWIIVLVDLVVHCSY